MRASLWVLLVAMGCGGSAVTDAGTEATDSGTPDSGTSDSGTSDSGTSDSGTSDAGTSDAGTSDAGTSDAGTSDAGTSDAGTPDAGTSDAGTPVELSFATLSLQAGESRSIGNVELRYQLDGNLVAYRLHQQLPAEVLWDAQVARACTPTTCVANFSAATGLRLLENGAVYWQSAHLAGATTLTLSRIAPTLTIRDGAGHVLWTGVDRLNWVSVLDPYGFYAGRMGVLDYSNLTSSTADWPRVSKSTQVFKVYAQFVETADAGVLSGLFRFLEANDIALAVEFGAVEYAQVGACATEGVTSEGTARNLANTIAAAGGRLRYLAMDEPFYYAHVQPPLPSCALTPDQLAQKAASSFQAFRQVFPSVVIGDLEPFSAINAWSTEFPLYQQFVTRFTQLTNAPIAFVHDDVSFSPAWVARAAAVQSWAAADQRAWGTFWNGAGGTTGLQWVAQAVAKVQRFETLGLSPARHNVFQSWEVEPRSALPETSPSALTFVANYVLARSAAVAPPSSAMVYRFHGNATTDFLFSTDAGVTPGFTLDGPAFKVLPTATSATTPLYLCTAGATHFLSTALDCNGRAPNGALLGHLSSSLKPEHPAPLYECLHTGGARLSTTSPAECLDAVGWSVVSVHGYGAR